MKTRYQSIALLAAGCLFSTAGIAQEEPDEHHVLDEIIVSATPLDRTVEELAQPTSVIGGDALLRSQAPTIGETLANQPGVSATYFGPASSRPIIRGQFGERVRVLTNGLDALDASALSEDHAVSLDAILADRVEIIRGPATLLYGSGAAGGIVNIVDSRIHETPLETGFSGALSLGMASATDAESLAGKVDFGSENFSFHLDAFDRSTENVEIPGFAESALQRALEEEEHEEEEEEEHHEEAEAFGVAENTDSSTKGSAAAFTWHGASGFLGFSVSSFDSDYGIPGHGHHEEEGGAEEEEEEAVRIDLEQERYDLTGQFDFNSFIERARFRIARNEYTHTELEGSEIGTVFDTDGTDARIELRHRPMGNLEGAIGFQLKQIDFLAIGDEAFVPPSDTEQLSLFLFEELVVNENWVLQGSARIEQQDITSPGLISYDDTAFGASIGAIWSPTDVLSVATNLSVTERHPNSTELYADGPHLAVQRVERGSVVTSGAILDKEVSTNLDVTLRTQVGPLAVQVTGFINNVDDYILLRPTAEIEDELQVFEYGQADVELYGVEAEGLFDIFDSDNGHMHARLSADFVHGEETSGAYLPRLPPLRYGLGLHYTFDRFDASVEAIRHDDQRNTAVNELPTDAYTLVNVELSIRFANDRLFAYLRGSNLGDEDARRHTSPLKDLVPLPGRSMRLGLRWDF